MKQDTRHQDLIYDAVDALQTQTHRVLAPAVHVDRIQNPAFDAVVDLMWDQQPLTYQVEVKPTLNAATMGRVAELFGRTLHPALLVTKAVTPAVAEKLRELNIQFIDMAGNAFLNAPGVYLFIQGNKAAEPEACESAKGYLYYGRDEGDFCLTVPSGTCERYLPGDRKSGRRRFGNGQPDPHGHAAPRLPD